MDQNSLAAMLAIKRPVVVAPEVNPKNPLHASTKVLESRIHYGFETQGKRHQKVKTGLMSFQI